MAKIVLGCDKNGINDKEYQNTVKKILEKAGHTVETLAISATPFGVYGYQNKAKGKIGVYLMAASLVSVTDVASSGWKFKHTYFGIRSDASRSIKSQKNFETKGIPKDHHGDCTNSFCDKWQGKTYPQINKIIEGRGTVLFSPNPKDFANNLVNILGGGSPSNYSSSGSSGSSGTGSSTASSDVSPLLQGEMTFEELVGDLCNGIDLLFLTKKSVVVVDDFSSIYAQAKYFRDKKSDIIKEEDIKLWQLEEDSYELEINQHGFYNTVYVKYKNGTVKESYDDFVRVYGEIPITYKDPKVNKTTAQMKAKAYLAAHIRDFGMTVNANILDNGDIDIGDIVTLENPKTLTNQIKVSKKLDPEYLFVNGINRTWEGDGYISNGIELRFAPTSPKNAEVPTSGTATGKDTSSNNKNSSSSKIDGITFNKCGQSSDGKLVASISQPSAGKTDGYNYSTRYLTIFENKCPRCGGTNLRWDSGRAGADCITCGGYHGSKREWGNISEGEVSCNDCCSDFCGTTGWEKDGKYSSKLKTYQKPIKSSKAESLKLSKGNYTI